MDPDSDVSTEWTYTGEYEHWQIMSNESGSPYRWNAIPSGATMSTIGQGYTEIVDEFTLTDPTSGEVWEDGVRDFNVWVYGVVGNNGYLKASIKLGESWREVDLLAWGGAADGSPHWYHASFWIDTSQEKLESAKLKLKGYGPGDTVYCTTAYAAYVAVTRYIVFPETSNWSPNASSRASSHASSLASNLASSYASSAASTGASWLVGISCQESTHACSGVCEIDAYRVCGINYTSYFRSVWWSTPYWHLVSRGGTLDRSSIWPYIFEGFTQCYWDYRAGFGIGSRMTLFDCGGWWYMYLNYEHGQYQALYRGGESDCPVTGFYHQVSENHWGGDGAPTTQEVQACYWYCYRIRDWYESSTCSGEPDSDVTFATPLSDCSTVDPTCQTDGERSWRHTIVSGPYNNEQESMDAGCD